MASKTWRKAFWWLWRAHPDNYELPGRVTATQWRTKEQMCRQAMRGFLAQSNWKRRVKSSTEPVWDR